jgi:hypothetical protein
MEQPGSQLMAADQRGLSRLDARRSEDALLVWNQPCIDLAFALSGEQASCSETEPGGGMGDERDRIAPSAASLW